MIAKLTEGEIYSRVKDILQKVVYSSISLDGMTLDSRLKDDLDIDSIRVVDLAVDVEGDFGIRIEDETIESIRTVRDLVELIRKKTA